MTAVAAILAGISWIVAIDLVGARPERLADEHRSVGDVLPWLLGGWVLVVVALRGLVRMRVLANGSRYVVAIAAAGLGATAVAALLIGSGASGVGIPLYLVGYATFALGMVAAAVALLRSGRLGSGPALALLAGSVLLFLFDTDDLRIFFGLPFAVAWIWIGLALARRPATADALG